MDSILELVLQFGLLAGVAGLVMVLVNVLKRFGAVQDGTADKWAAGLNLAFFTALVVLRVFWPDVSLLVVDELAAQVTTIIMFVAGLVFQIVGSGRWYEASRGTVLGYSFPGDEK